jgi:hypothetical protein
MIHLAADQLSPCVHKKITAESQQEIKKKQIKETKNEKIK